DVPVEHLAVVDDGEGPAHDHSAAFGIEVQLSELGLYLRDHLLEERGVRLVPGPHVSASHGFVGVVTEAAARRSESTFASFDFSSTVPNTACHPDFSMLSRVARPTVASSFRTDVSSSGLRSLPVALAGSSIERLAEWSRNS